MINAGTNIQPMNRVTAIFADGSQSFLLPQDATLEDIADRIDDLGVRHERPAIAVVVSCAATALEGSAPKLATSFGIEFASRTAPASGVLEIRSSQLRSGR